MSAHQTKVIEGGRRPGSHSFLPAAGICTCVFLVLLILWRLGLFQFFELRIYDAFLRADASTAGGVSPIVVVGITEEDLQRLNTYPIPDEALAAALGRLADAEPAVIVVDLFRNLPVPGQDPHGRNKLAAVFEAHSNIIAIQRLGLGNEPAVPPPPYLATTPEQVGFNDFAVLDQGIDDSVRRVTLMMEEFENVYYSDPLLATILYLQKHGIDFRQDPTQPERLHLGKSALRRLASNDGPYVDADARGYQVLLNFRGSARFPTYEFADALHGNFPPEIIRGKVVYLGPLATSLKDFLNTPLQGRYPGLLLHAQTVDQLIRCALTGEPQLRFLNEWQEGSWILLWCIAGMIIGASARSPLVLTAVFAGAVIVLFLSYWVALQSGLWILVFAPAMGLVGAAALSVARQAYLEKHQREVLMNLFAQHVSANIASDVWKRRNEFMDGHRPKPQVIQGTVFFTDLKGFTNHAESMAPEDLIRWLNEYMEVMADLIEKHDGMVIKYMGDAIMAAFGAPIPRTRPDEIKRDAEGAARCALVMASELDRLNEAWKTRGLPTTSMRIGMASGPLVSGSIGGARRLEYTVTGDTVVVAKRLEGTEKDAAYIEMASLSCRVLMSGEMASLLSTRFESRKLGPMKLEGRNKLVDVWVLIRENEAGKAS